MLDLDTIEQDAGVADGAARARNREKLAIHIVRTGSRFILPP
jgi:hypothetical protein